MIGMLSVDSPDVRIHSKSVQDSVDEVEVRAPVAFLVEIVNPNDVGKTKDGVVVGMGGQLSVVPRVSGHSGSSGHHQGTDAVVDSSGESVALAWAADALNETSRVTDLVAVRHVSVAISPVPKRHDSSTHVLVEYTGTRAVYCS